MRILQAAATTIPALLLAACASGGPTGSEVLTSSITPQMSRLVVYRPSIMGFAVQPNYLVNGRAVANSQPQGFIVCDLQPGPHEVAVENAQLNVNFGGGNDRAKINLAPGETQYFKADMQVGLTVGVLTLTQVTEQQGRTDAAALSKIPASCT